MRLTSWDEMRAYLSAKHKTLSDGDTLRLVIVENGTVDVRPVEVEGARWLEISAILGRGLRSIAPTPVLNKNFELAIGVLGMRDGSLMIRQLLPAMALRVGDLDEVVQATADAIVESNQ
jgi:hypothetical protein